MRYIAFVSTLPDLPNLRDGYYQRVHFVDQALSKDTRIHLDIRFQANFIKTRNVINEKKQIIHLNAIIHFFQITSILRKSGIVYIHSVAKVPSVLLSLLLIKRHVPIAIDLHGLIVEELQLSGKKFKAFVYSWVERLSFRISSLSIYVNESMQIHFRTKYPGYLGADSIVVPNGEPNLPIPQHDTCDTQPLNVVNLQRVLNIKDSDVVFIYSGNCQAYQNVELMLDLIKDLKNPGYKFIILTGQPAMINQLIASKQIPSNKISVLSVDPKELSDYYKIAHYGFILRDDILVNRVANPTKLAEYLQYGIIPVVKLVDIGDYARFDYEYLSYGDLNNELIAKRSSKNQDIYGDICRKYGSEPLIEAVNQIQNRYITPSKA